HRLANRDECVERRLAEDEANLAAADEARLDQCRDQHQHAEHGDDPERARAQHDVDEPARAGQRGLLRRLLGGAHAGLTSTAAGTPACPVAAAMIASSEASACASSSTRRPSRMTRIRSATASTSGSSEEIISTATPLRESSTSSR